MNQCTNFLLFPGYATLQIIRPPQVLHSYGHEVYLGKLKVHQPSLSYSSCSGMNSLDSFCSFVCGLRRCGKSERQSEKG